jgi:hypothetical protein
VHRLEHDAHAAAAEHGSEPVLPGEHLADLRDARFAPVAHPRPSAFVARSVMRAEQRYTLAEEDQTERGFPSCAGSPPPPATRSKVTNRLLCVLCAREVPDRPR